MKTIINEEIKRIQELMGFQKPLINEQWLRVIDDLLRGTAKTDNFYTNIARFGGKTANELEAALKRGEDILTALGKSENEFAAFVKNDNIIFKKFADEFVTTTDAINLEQSYMEGLSKLTTKDDIENKLREIMALAKRDNQLGDMAVAQKMYKNLDTISTKLTARTVQKQFNNVDEFIQSSTFNVNFSGNSRATRNAYEDFCRRNWDSIKNLKSEKEVFDFMKNESGILSTKKEKDYFTKFITNWNWRKTLGLTTVIVSAPIIFAALWTASAFTKCLFKNKDNPKVPSAPAFCAMRFFMGSAESMIEATEKIDQQSDDTEEDGVEQSTKSPLYSGDENGFKEWCRDNGYSGCYFDTELNNFIDDELNKYTYDKEKGIYKPK